MKQVVGFKLAQKRDKKDLLKAKDDLKESQLLVAKLSQQVDKLEQQLKQA